MYEGDMMMTKSKDPRSFLTRMAQIGLGLLMIAGAVWAITQPGTALNTLMVILGLMLLLRGTAGIVPYYRLKDKPILKDKAGLALGVLLIILGILMLAVPDFLAPTLKWAAAGAFALTAARGLIASGAMRAKNRNLGTLSLVLNLALMAAAILLVLNPLPNLFTLPILLTAALLCAGADLVIDVAIPREK